jgi:hypothetical protein
MREALRPWAWVIVAAACAGLAACGDDPGSDIDAGADADTDADTDSDTDSDADTDTDTDTDADADTDTDTDADTDSDTDSDADTDADAGADAGAFDMTIDLDCTNPLPGHAAGDTCDLPGSDCAAGVCSERLWEGTELASQVIGSYCYADCSPEGDAGALGECEGSASYCVPFDGVGAIAGCAPAGQLKAEWEVNLVPADVDAVSADQHEFPIAESFNCEALGFTSAVGKVNADSVDGDSAVITFRIVESMAPPQFTLLRVTIPMSSFVEGATLDLSAEPGAFGALLFRLELESLVDQTVTAAQLRAFAVSGRIHIDEVAAPCGGSGCATSKGTMSLVFLMVDADLDPAMFAE